MTWNRWSHSSICNKNDANSIFSGWYKIGFEIKNEIEGQGQSSPKFSGILRVLRCIIGPNLEILSWIGGEWWHGQGQNMAVFYFEVKFDLEVQGQLTPKTIGILTKVFCSSGPNLVILAGTGDKLSRGQASDYRTHRRTHRQTQATTIPEGQNWPRVIKLLLRDTVHQISRGESAAAGLTAGQPRPRTPRGRLGSIWKSRSSVFRKLHPPTPQLILKYKPCHSWIIWMTNIALITVNKLAWKEFSWWQLTQPCVTFFSIRTLTLC